MKKEKVNNQLDSRLLAISERIKKLRIEKGFTSYEQFAFEYKLPRSGYGNHEKGRNITLKSLLRILDIHGISLEDFFKDL